VVQIVPALFANAGIDFPAWTERFKSISPHARHRMSISHRISTVASALLKKIAVNDRREP
jgi:hypothetical protein